MAAHRKIQGSNGTIAEVVESSKHGDGIKVFTYKGVGSENRGILATNPIYGINLNVDGSVSGVPLAIHDGTDTSLWTGSNIVGGKITFDSTNRPRTGTKSVEVLNPVTNDEWQFDNGASQDLSSYTSVSFWVNVDQDWNGADQVNFYGWDTALNQIVGVEVDISNYFTPTDFDVWQQVIIPLSDMSLEGSAIYAFRFRQIARTGKSGLFYIDDFQLEQTGGAITFSIKPPKNDVWDIHNLQFTFVDDYAGTHTNASMPDIPYDGILGLNTLGVGFRIRRVVDGVVTFSAVIQDFVDFIATPAPKQWMHGSDGTNTWVMIEVDFPDRFRLVGDDDDRLEIVIQDDMTGLTRFNVGANFAVKFTAEEER